MTSAVGPAVTVFDAKLNEWRGFTLAPHETQGFIARCGDDIHQFPITSRRCACGRFQRD